jgi:hypothetical protein
VRWKSDKVGRDEGARNAGFPNSAPDEKAVRKKSEDRAGNRVRKIRGNENGRESQEENWDQKALKTGRKVGPTVVQPGGTRVRNLTNAASRMGAVIASISNDSDLMDREDPFIPSRGTTAALSKPGSMNPGILVELTGGSGESTVEDVLAIDDTNGHIKTMGIAKQSDKVLDRSEVTEG